jgi:hypothetical protein
LAYPPLVLRDRDQVGRQAVLEQQQRPDAVGGGRRGHPAGKVAQVARPSRGPAVGVPDQAPPQHGRDMLERLEQGRRGRAARRRGAGPGSGAVRLGPQLDDQVLDRPPGGEELVEHPRLRLGGQVLARRPPGDLRAGNGERPGGLLERLAARVQRVGQLGPEHPQLRGTDHRGVRRRLARPRAVPGLVGCGAGQRHRERGERLGLHLEPECAGGGLPAGRHRTQLVEPVPVPEQGVPALAEILAVQIGVRHEIPGQLQAEAGVDEDERRRVQRARSRPDGAHDRPGGLLSRVDQRPDPVQSHQRVQRQLGAVQPVFAQAGPRPEALQGGCHADDGGI